MNAVELTDGYKLDHRRQYPEGTEFVYSNWTPRSNEYFHQAKDGCVVFGVQYFVKKYLIEYFNINFFNIDEEVAVNSFKRRIDYFLGENNVGTEHIRDLHKLGYLPVRIKSLPEGSICPIRVPMLTIINTDPKFFWLTNYIETLMSCELWLPMTSATTARVYRKEIERHAEKTGFNKDVALGFLCHDFSMRGMAGIEASITSGMGHLTSFFGTETIPAIYAVEKYYNANVENELVAATVPASEHSVMCAGGMEDEFGTFKRFITELYPKGFVSIVSDTWDLWKVVTDYVPRLKNEILSRNGRLVIRPDSGDPVDIICGVSDDVIHIEDNFETVEDAEYFYTDVILNRVRETTPHGELGPTEYSMVFEYKGEYTKVTLTNITWNRYDKQYYFIEMWEKAKLICEKLDDTIYKGVYELLWDTFGGHVNEKGYKVLDSHIGVIYGDSITIERQKEIYKRLEEKGFAATNLVLGIGSYTYQYRTRDSLGFAMKATWCQINGEHKEIFKSPKTDSGMKKSLKGLIRVDKDENGVYYATDCVSKEKEDGGCLEVVFENGKLKKEVSLKEIRERLCK